jgi:phosphatidylglycerophosphate synthase
MNSPNLITLLGFLCIVGNTATVLYYSGPDLSAPAPSWVYYRYVAQNNKLYSADVYSCALGLWIYQSMDAIDGKQARRTGTSSPLGQLFDHGFVPDFFIIFMHHNPLA